MRGRQGLVAWALVVCGCTSAEPSVVDPPPAKAGAARAPAKVEPNKQPTPTPAPATPSEATAWPWSTEAEASVEVPGGKIVQLAAVPDGANNVLWARELDPGAGAVGTATKLRTTSGTVGKIAATVAGATLWVAWKSNLGEDKKSVVAVGGFDLALKTTHKPRILRTFEDTADEEGGLLVSSRGSSGGVAVAALRGRRACRGAVPDENGSCQGLQVDLIAADGSSVRSETRWLNGGDGELVDLVDAGAGVVASFHVWRGGPVTEVTFIPDAADRPIVELAVCEYPPIDLAVVDGSVVSVCPDPDAEDGERGPTIDCSAGKDGGSCGMLARVSVAGKRLPPSTSKVAAVTLSAIAQRCDDGVPAVRLGWGAAAKSGASFVDVPAAALSFAKGHGRCPPSK